MHSTETIWLDGMAFETRMNGHQLTVDADDAFGGQDKGPQPKILILSALAGCSAMDVISILKKMKQPVSWFKVRVEADVAEEHPKVYTDIRIMFEFKKTDGLEDAKIRKAITLSQEQYCAVSAMLQKVVNLDWDIAYLD